MMRRKDREITDLNEIMEIIKKCDVCRLAFFDEEYPYLIPMNFGVSIIADSIEFYFHGAKVGKKIELMMNNNKVAFEMDCSHKLLIGEKACDTTMEYESVCGNGSIMLLEEQEKVEALTYLMNQYTPKEHHEFDPNVIKAVAVFKLVVNEISGKRLKRS